MFETCSFIVFVKTERKIHIVATGTKAIIFQTSILWGTFTLKQLLHLEIFTTYLFRMRGTIFTMPDRLRFVQFAENRLSCKYGLHACIFHRPLIYFNNLVKFRILLDQKVSPGRRSLKDRFSGLAASRKGGHKFLYSFAPACVDYQNKTINSGCGAAIYRKCCLRFRCMSTVHDRTLFVIMGLPRGLFYI